MRVFLILALVPLIEIALFVAAGDVVGFWPTIALVLITAAIGAIALRMQGLQTLRRAQALSSPQDAAEVLSDGLLLAVAGLLLLTPGFLTDAIGFSLLAPPVRRAIARRAARGIAVHMAGAEGGPGPAAHGAQRPPAAEPEPADDRGPGDRTPPFSQGAPKPDSPWRGDVEDAEILPDDPPRR